MRYSVEVTGLDKYFGRFQALKNVNLQVAEGEVFAYIGPNGAGKSTTIRVLLGILQASKGTARVFGQDAWKDAVDIHKRIAYVPGDVNLWPNLTGGEVIDLFVSLRGTYDKALRQRLIRDFNLDPTKKCRTYSKGNRQKVALIAAFASEVDLYILDEPTSGLDPLMEQVFQDCVMEQKNKGKGVFLSSHIMSEVERLCDRVGIIREGEVVQTGTLDELRHLTRYAMTVTTERTVEGLDKLAGVHDIAKEAYGLHFYVDVTQMGAIINHLNGFGITKLESVPPSLEELFMQHYKKEGA
ncbi:MAG: ABC transporter ATP-binding protein [Defluviitaleaceae bacterium]|nr:ABC transporter ATP-binding protein [Defluviitaleaceae bacterium]MCL2240698.1 ABC transporter ATP-binding protein [Defluviitaleaceae bacterium]